MRLGQTSVVYYASRIAASVVGFLAIVYFSRELGATVVGMYFLAQAIVSWVVVLSTAGTTSAITRFVSAAEEDVDAYLAAGTSLQLLLIVGGAVVLFAFRGQVDAFVGARVTTLIIAIAVLNSAFTALGAYIQGRQRVDVLGFLETTKQATTAVLQIAVVVLGYGLIGLLTAQAAAAGLLVLLALGVSRARLVPPNRRHLVELVGFAKYSWLGGLQGKTYVYLDTLVIGMFAASQFVGFYQVSFNAAAFLGLFGVAVSRVLFPAMSAASRVDKDSVGGLFDDALTFSGVLVVPGAVGAVLVGADVLRIFGPEFAVAHWVLVILVGSQLAYVYMTQAVNVLNAIDRPDLSFRVNAVFIVTNLVLNLILVPTTGYVGAAVASLATTVVGFGLGYRMVAARVPVTLPVGEFGRQVVAALVMGVVLWAGLQVRTPVELPGPPAAGTVVYVTVGALVYGVALYALSARVRSVVRENAPEPPASLSR